MGRVKSLPIIASNKKVIVIRTFCDRACSIIGSIVILFDEEAHLFNPFGLGFDRFDTRPGL